MSKATLPFESLTAEQVSTVKVDVIGGADEGQSVASEGRLLTVGTAQGNDLVLSDPTVSRYHVEFEATADGIRAVDHRSTNGTLCGGIRLEQGVLPPEATVQIGQTTLRVHTGGTHKAPAAPRIEGLVGQSPGMRELAGRIEKAAKSGVSTLIVGESGTGKELVAQALHERSDRASGPFVTVDCGSISPNLVASELFGHERGAFTGAERRHIGAFERASGGTVFLDEIGELPESLQPTLLGALERRRFRRVGGSEDLSVDVRVVAATNRDLRAEVNEKRFRLDLYYRLAVVTLRIPPLRDRTEDIPELVAFFAAEFGAAEGPFDDTTLRNLQRHTWPGNVRELRNYVEASIAMGEQPETPDVAMGPESDLIASVLPMTYKDARAALLVEFEKRFLSHWLDKSEGNVAATARATEMDRSHLFQLLKRHKLRDR